MKLTTNDALSRSKKALGSASLANAGRVATNAPVDRPDHGHEARQSTTLPNGIEIVRFIVEQIQKNLKGEVFAEIALELRKFRNLTGEDQAPATRLLHLYRALNLFRKTVTKGADWDYKQEIRTRWGAVSLIFGVEIAWDVWANIHYGFIGLRVGFNPELLRRAAGVAQLMDRTVPDDWIEKVALRGEALFEALDDSYDQAAINIGIELGEMDGDPNEEKLLKILRARLGKITKID